MTPATAPTASLAGFAALLRDHGFSVGVSEQQAMLQAALRIGGWRETPLAAAWRAIACHRQRDWRQWPELFERYWHPERLRGTVKVSGQTRPRRDLRQAVADLQDQLGSSSAPQAQTNPSATAGDAPASDSAQDSPRAQGGASRSRPCTTAKASSGCPTNWASCNAWRARSMNACARAPRAAGRPPTQAVAWTCAAPCAAAWPGAASRWHLPGKCAAPNARACSSWWT